MDTRGTFLLCVDTFLAQVVPINRWLLLGGLAGPVLGLALSWALRLGGTAAPDYQLAGRTKWSRAADLALFSETLSATTDPQPILTRLHEEAMRATGATCRSSLLFEATAVHHVALGAGEAAEPYQLSAIETAVVDSARSPGRRATHGHRTADSGPVTDPHAHS